MNGVLACELVKQASYQCFVGLQCDFTSVSTVIDSCRQ